MAHLDERQRPEAGGGVDDPGLSDTPGSRFNADEMEFESFMFDPGQGGQELLRTSGPISAATLEVANPSQTRVNGNASGEHPDNDELPAWLMAGTEETPVADEPSYPIQPGEPAEQAEQVFEENWWASVPPFAPGGQVADQLFPTAEVPTEPQFQAQEEIQAAQPTTTAGPAPVPVSGQPMPLPDYLQTPPGTPTGTSPRLSAENLPFPSGPLDHQEALHTTGSLAKQMPADTGASHVSEPLNATQLQAEETRTPTGPLSSVHLASGPLSWSSVAHAGRSGNTGPLSTGSFGSVNETGSSGPLAPSMADTTDTQAEPAQPVSYAGSPSTWSDSSLASIEDFSAVLLALQAGKHVQNGYSLSVMGTAPTVLTHEPPKEVEAESAPQVPEAPEPLEAQVVTLAEPELIEDVQQAQPAEVEASHVEQVAPELEQVPAEPEVVEPQAVESQIAELPTGEQQMDEAPVIEQQAPDMQTAEPVAAAKTGDNTQAQVKEGAFSPTDLEFENFMFDAGVAASLPVLPNVEAFAPAVQDLESAFQGLPSGELAQATQPSALAPEATAVPTDDEPQSLPFWLEDSGPLRSSDVNSPEAPGMAEQEIPKIEQPANEMATPGIFGTPPADLYSAEPEQEEGVAAEQARQAADQPYDQPVAELQPEPEPKSAHHNDYSELPPIEPFDFSMLSAPETEEKLGFDMSELSGTGTEASPHERMAVTANLQALDDLLTGNATPIGIESRPFPPKRPASELTSPQLWEGGPYGRPAPWDESGGWVEPKQAPDQPEPVMEVPTVAELDNKAIEAPAEAPETGHPDNQKDGGHKPGWTATVTSNLSMDALSHRTDPLSGSNLSDDDSLTEGLGISPFDYTQLDLEDELSDDIGTSSLTSQYLNSQNLNRTPTAKLEPIIEPGQGYRGEPSPSWHDTVQIDDTDQEAWSDVSAETGLFGDTYEEAEQENDLPTGWLSDEKTLQFQGESQPETEAMAEIDRGLPTTPVGEPVAYAEGEVPLAEIFKARVVPPAFTPYTSPFTETEQQWAQSQPVEVEQQVEEQQPPAMEQQQIEQPAHIGLVKETHQVEHKPREKSHRASHPKAKESHEATPQPEALAEPTPVVQEQSTVETASESRPARMPSDIFTSGPLPAIDGSEELREIVAQNPNDIGAHMALAAAYIQSSDYDGALRVYRRLLRKRSIPAPILSMIGEELRDFEEEVYGEPRYHLVLGDLYTKQGHYKEAIEEYNRIS